MLLSEEKCMLEILLRQGKPYKEIARETGHSINTVRKYVRDKGEVGYRRRAIKPGKLIPFEGYLQSRMNQAKPKWLPATVLFEEIRAQGYQGSLSLLRQYLRKYKPKAASFQTVIRFETAPGKQLQQESED